MIDREIRILFRKEWRQLVAGKSALLTGAILPLILLGLVPFSMGYASRSPPHGHTPPAMQFGVIGEIGDDPRHLAGAMLPLLVAVVGMVLPTMMASYLLITERERRTLELLIALPVRIEQVLLAKLLATLVASSIMAVPLLAFDLVALPLMGAATVEQIVALPVLLIAALALSTSTALLMSLLAKDFRTANNIAGAMLAPTIIATLMLGMCLPGGVIRPIGIAVVYTCANLLVLRYALRTVTFERLLS